MTLQKEQKKKKEQEKAGCYDCWKVPNNNIKS